jgi:hypothetical protein
MDRLDTHTKKKLLAVLIILFTLFDSSKSSLACLAPLQAILFDIDGTLCDSDPLHYYAFREMLQEVFLKISCYVVSY